MLSDVIMLQLSSMVVAASCVAQHTVDEGKDLQIILTSPQTDAWLQLGHN